MTVLPAPDAPACGAPRVEPPEDPLPGWAAERDRLAALARYEVLDTPAEEAFDDLCALAAEICGTPTALVSLVDEGRQWFKARLGLEVCSTSRDVAFCAYALTQRQVLVVPDATADPRFADNPLVTGPPGIRFYAGVPLVTPDGFTLGTLCVIDTVARDLTRRQEQLLRMLAGQVMTQLEHRRQSHELVVEAAARQVSEAAHAQTRRVLDGVLENTDVVVYAKGTDGRFLLANPALHRLIGQGDGQVVGRTNHDLFGAEDADAFRDNDRAVAASGTTQVLRETLTHPDGTAHSYLSTKFPLRDADGHVYAVAGVSTDVTELARARAELAESTQRWQSLVEHSPVAVAVYGATDLRFRYANTPAVRLYGASTVDGLLGRSFLDLFTGDERAADLHRLARILAGETIIGAEARIIGFDGHGRDVEVNASAVTWDGERAVQVEMRDITARVTAEAALRTSEQRFRVLFDTAAVGMVELLPDGTLLAVNPTMCSLLGYAAHELIGRPIEMLIDPSDPSDPVDLRRAIARLSSPDSPRGYTVQRTYRHKNGTRLQVMVSVASIRDESDQVQRVVASFVDVTERVAMEERLRETASRLAERQAFTDALVDNVEVGIVACDAEGHLTTFNGAAKLWHGVDADVALDPAEFARHFDLYEADGATALATERIPLLAALQTGGVVDAEMVIAPKDLPPTRVLCNGQVLRDEKGTIRGAVVAMHDITVLRAGEQKLREHAAFQDAVLAASPDLIYLLDPIGNRHVWSSGNMMEMLGYTDTQVQQLGSAVHATLVHPDDVPRLRAANAASRSLDDGQVLQIRYRAMAADGHFRWLSRRATPFRRDTDGEVTQLLAVARDVTEIVQVEERMTEAALHDPLTRLPNRTLLSDRLALALRRTDRTGTDVAILFCDLDGFKNVNDTAGHAAGDAVLIATAERLQAILRPQDTVARVGGDEFVVLLEPLQQGAAVARPGPADSSPALQDTADDDPRRDAAVVATRIEQALREPVTVAGVQHVVTVSIGMTFARAGDDPDEALRDADSAMYRAKTRGKDRHEVFDTSLRADAVERGRVEQVLRAALHHLPAAAGPREPQQDRARLGLAYQPIVDLASQRLVGVEALARLTDADGRPIGPDQFIPIAEETGLIAPLGQYVLDTACRDLAGWHARHPAQRHLRMSVNLSARQAGLTDLVQQVQDALTNAGLAAGCLTLELTESVLLAAGRSTTTALRALRDHGVHISIDDFGTGYASLRYLAELPVTGVKVDQSFTRGLPHDPTSTTIVNVISSLAEQLGLSCVVEGIETDEQLLALPPGVLGQGYLLGRPQNAAALDRLLGDVHGGPPDLTTPTTRSMDVR